MQRVLEPETLDHLAPDDPDAVRSRRDLQRVNAVLGARRVLIDELDRIVTTRQGDRSLPLRVLELGCGDGSLMLAVARKVATRWPPVQLTLLDRQPIVDLSTLSAYERLGWRATPSTVDVLDWAGWSGSADAAGPAPSHETYDLIVTNLFLHHFDGDVLDRLLSAVAHRTAAFVACEPRRGWVALIGSHLIGALGVNAVTRRDAVLSVRAGFRDDEIGRRWPVARSEWRIDEHAARLFSHSFTATRIDSVESSAGPPAVTSSATRRTADPTTP